MARLPYLDVGQAEPHVAAVLSKAPDLGIFRMVAHAQEQLDAIKRGDLEAGVLGADGRLVLRFTTQAVRDAQPDEETFAAMTARFSPRQIMHLLLVIGQYMMLGRIMATTQIDLEPAIGGDALRVAEQRLSSRPPNPD